MREAEGRKVWFPVFPIDRCKRSGSGGAGFKVLGRRIRRIPLRTLIWLRTQTVRIRQIGWAALLCAITLMLMTSAAVASCTWYTSPSGIDSNTGKSPDSPVSLKKAVRKTKPGDVVCLMAGTYYVDTP